MKKLLILITVLMLSIITAACSKTAPKGETGSNESGSTSSVISQQNTPPPNQPLIMWFDSESELAAWIADGGKWTGSWNGGWYDPRYDEEYEKNLFYNACIENGFYPNVIAGEEYEIGSISVSADKACIVFSVRSKNDEKTGRSRNRIIIDFLDAEKTALSLKEKIKSYELGYILNDYPNKVSTVTSKSMADENYSNFYVIDRIMREDDPTQTYMHQTVIFAKDNLLVHAVMYPEIDSVDILKDIFELELVYLNNSGSNVEIMNNEATEN